MCAIAGIMGENIENSVYKMLSTLKHRGPDKSGVFIDGKVAYGGLEYLLVPEVASEVGKKSIGMGHNLLSIVGSEIAQPLKADDIVLICNGEIYNYLQLRLDLEKETDYDFKTDSDSEVLLAFIIRYYDGSLKDCIPKVLKHFNGDFAFAVYDGKDIVAVRDPIGVKPLYYGSSNDYFGFASERKALWNIGIRKTHSLPPNMMLYCRELLNLELLPLPERLSWKYGSRRGSEQKSSDNYIDIDLDIKEKDVLKRILKNYILESVKKRIRGLEKVGILFSGGVDSTLLAKICDDMDVRTELYAVGSEGSPDLKFAEKIAEHMHLPIHVRIVDEDLVRECTPLVLNAIEEWNLMKLGVGMTSYLAAEMAHEDGFRVMLSGQGADELFAGYHRYLGFYQDKGEDVQEDLRGDVENLYHVNLERDDKVTMAHSVELRVPYLDLQIINMAMDIPMKYKISGEEDSLRKCILREVAAELGVPPEIVRRPKKAAQYGSGIHKILSKKVLKDEEYMEELKNSTQFIDL